MTVRDVVTHALRIAGVAGRTYALSAADGTAGLSVYNGMVRAMFGSVIGPALVGVRPTSALTIDSGANYYVGQSLMTLTLPNCPEDGDRFGIADVGALTTFPLTLARNGWLLEGAAANLTLSTTGTAATWFFRADTGNWERERDLTLDDDPYFPPELVPGLPFMLARTYSGEFGVPISPLDLDRAERAQGKFSSRYRKDLKFDPALWPRRRFNVFTGV